eukprot:Tbor_TRINITY_DN5301_c0_g7::TRINITY_DN5301_c0_g7_i1::g.4802::m.4802
MSSNRRHCDEGKGSYAQSSRRDPTHRGEVSRTNHHNHSSTAPSYRHDTARRRGRDSPPSSSSYFNSNYRGPMSSLALKSTHHHVPGRKRGRAPMGSSSNSARLSTIKADGVGGSRRVENIPRRSKGYSYTNLYEDSDFTSSSSSEYYDEYSDDSGVVDSVKEIGVGCRYGGVGGSRHSGTTSHTRMSPPMQVNLASVGRKMCDTRIRGDQGSHRRTVEQRGRISNENPRRRDTRRDGSVDHTGPQRSYNRNEQRGRFLYDDDDGIDGYHMDPYDPSHGVHRNVNGKNIDREAQKEQWGFNSSSHRVNTSSQVDRMLAQYRAVKEKDDKSIKGGQEDHQQKWSVLGAPPVKQSLAVIGNVDVSVREVHLRNICAHFGVELVRSSRKIVGGLIGFYYNQWKEKKRLLEKFREHIEELRLRKKKEKEAVVNEKALQALLVLKDSRDSCIVPLSVVGEENGVGEVGADLEQDVKITGESSTLPSSGVVDGHTDTQDEDNMTSVTLTASTHLPQHHELEQSIDDEEDKMNQQEFIELEIELLNLKKILEKKLQGMPSVVVEQDIDKKEQVCNIGDEEVKPQYCLSTRIIKAAEAHIQRYEEANIEKYGSPLPSISATGASLPDTHSYDTSDSVVLQFKSNDDLSLAVTYLNGASLNGRTVHVGVFSYAPG